MQALQHDWRWQSSTTKWTKCNLVVLFEAACGNLVIVSEGLNVGVYEKDQIHFTFDTGVAQSLLWLGIHLLKILCTDIDEQLTRDKHYKRSTKT